MRLCLTATVILVLLGGSAQAILVHEDEPGRTDGSTAVSGLVQSWANVFDGEFVEEGVRSHDWVGCWRGMNFTGEFEWSDSRLPREAEVIFNFDAYGEVGVAYNNMWLLKDADGYWAGPWTGWCDLDSDTCSGVVILTGHGAYAGFYAILAERPDGSETGFQGFEGAILRGEPPPMPDPVEPSAEQPHPTPAAA